MLQLPREVNPNEPIRASEWNLMVRYLRSITPRSSTTNRVVVGPGGTKHLPVFPVPAGAPPMGTSLPYPWRVYDASVGSTAQIRVNSGDGQAGSINDITANIGGVAIDYVGDSPPLLTCSDGDDLFATLTLDSTGTVIETGDALGVTLSCGTMPGTDTAVPPTYAVKRIAKLSVTVTDGVARVTAVPYANTQLWFQMCFNNPLFGTTSA